MQTQNQPENQNSHPAHDLGQITKEHARLMQKCQICGTPTWTDWQSQFIPFSAGETCEHNHGPQPGSREYIEALLDALEGMSLRTNINALHRTCRGSYRVTIAVSAQWNEITVTLKDGTGTVATGYVDRGHTKESRMDAAQELRGLVRGYLCR